MMGAMHRRSILKGGLAAGAALVLPTRAFAEPDPLGNAFDQAFPGRIPAETPEEVVPPGPPLFTGNSRAYEQRVLEIGSRERDRAGAALWRNDIVGIADFARPSAYPRLHFANLEAGTVRSFFVAHGRGSDPEHDGWLKNFSNVNGSEATSRGSYLTCEWYNGKYGTSIRLEGLDGDNSNALERAIVIHPAWYAAPGVIARQGKLGRSEGCFAMAPEQFSEALWHLSGGRLLYADRIGDV